ncbi:7507_t:CDS:2, partial [Ambispora leptoticha]
RSRSSRRAVDERLFAQNRALYILIQDLHNNVREIKTELNRQQRDSNNDLSSQDVYLNVVKRLFPKQIYPSQSTLKEALKDYLSEIYPEYMSEISANEYTNCFH